MSAKNYTSMSMERVKINERKSTCNQNNLENSCYKVFKRIPSSTEKKNRKIQISLIIYVLIAGHRREMSVMFLYEAMKQLCGIYLFMFIRVLSYYCLIISLDI